MGIDSEPLLGDSVEVKEEQELPEYYGYKKGVDQGPVYRDIGFGISYYIHLMIVIAIAAVYGGDVLNPDESSDSSDEADTDTEDWTGYVYISIICGCAAIVLSAIIFAIMTRLTTRFLWFSTCLSLILTIIFLIIGKGGVTLAILLLFHSCYLCCFLRYIPFAQVNMITAITAIHANWGVILVAFNILLMSFVLAFTSLLAISGVAKANEVKGCDVDEGCEEARFIFLIFSLYWIQQVMKNTIHVIVAGTVGTWWISPEEASSWLSRGVLDSTRRATTYSFGSICYGSLIVAIVEALKTIENLGRMNHEDTNILMCLVECILDCIESFFEYFNKWAYVYVVSSTTCYFLVLKQILSHPFLMSRACMDTLIVRLEKMSLSYLRLVVGK